MVSGETRLARWNSGSQSGRSYIDSVVSSARPTLTRTLPTPAARRAATQMDIDMKSRITVQNFSQTAKVGVKRIVWISQRHLCNRSRSDAESATEILSHDTRRASRNGIRTRKAAQNSAECKQAKASVLVLAAGWKMTMRGVRLLHGGPSPPFFLFTGSRRRMIYSQVTCSSATLIRGLYHAYGFHPDEEIQYADTGPQDEPLSVSGLSQ